MKKYITLLCTMTCLANYMGEWEADSRYFNTTLLSDAAQIKQILMNEENFAEISFTSSDNLRLEGLARFVENPQFSIILCSGFFPGKQQGMASFVNMLPKNCNIIMYNARGKGSSEGKLDLYNIWSYGSKEYQDVIGAMRFTHDKSSAPLFILGLCAGSFHALHAAARVDQNHHNIRGIIVDSGMTSVKTMSETAVDGIIKKNIARPWAQTAALYAIHFFRVFLYRPLIAWAKHMRLSNIIKKISAPIFYIHAKNDAFAPFESIKKLDGETPQSEHWWIEKSKHACHHLKYQQEYRNQLIKFIKKQITT